MRLLKVLLVLSCLLLVALFDLARLNLESPEAAQDSPAKAPASGLAWLFERFKLPQMSFDALRKSEEVPNRATLPRPIDLSPDDPNSLPRASAASPDFAAIKDTKMRKKSFFEFMAPLIEAENIQLEGKRLQLLRLHEGVQKGKTLSDYDKEWLRNLSQEYRVSTEELSMDALF